MHPVEKDITIYTTTKGSAGGSLEYVASGFESIEKAEEYLDEKAESKVYYVILTTYRRQ